MQTKLNKKQIAITIKPELLQKLKERKTEIGVPISIQIEKLIEARK